MLDIFVFTCGISVDIRLKTNSKFQCINAFVFKWYKKIRPKCISSDDWWAYVSRKVSIKGRMFYRSKCWCNTIKDQVMLPCKMPFIYASVASSHYMKKQFRFQTKLTIGWCWYSILLKIFVHWRSVIYTLYAEIKYILWKFTLIGRPYGDEWGCGIFYNVGEKLSFEIRWCWSFSSCCALKELNTCLVHLYMSYWTFLWLLVFYHILLISIFGNDFKAFWTTVWHWMNLV